MLQLFPANIAILTLDVKGADAIFLEDISVDETIVMQNYYFSDYYLWVFQTWR